MSRGVERWWSEGTETRENGHTEVDGQMNGKGRFETKREGELHGLGTDRELGRIDRR